MKKLDPPKNDDEKESKTYIKLPSDYSPELDDDQSFEAVVKIKRDGDKWCVVQLDGMELGDNDYEEEDEETLTFGQEVKNIVGGKKGVV